MSFLDVAYKEKRKKKSKQVKLLYENKVENTA